MCDVNGPFKLCTCSTKVDRRKPHWVLHRHILNREKLEMMGEFGTPDPYTVISERSLQRRLNSVNVFDFAYEPEEGDFLELFLNPEIEDDEEDFYPDYVVEFRKAKWRLLDTFESYRFTHKKTQSGEIIGPKSELTIAYEKFKLNASEQHLHNFQYFSNQYIDPSLQRTKKGLIAYFKNIVPFLLIAVFLFACDLQPIDYSKKTRRSSFTRSSVTQTGRLRKAHARKGVSTSKRAFKNRINSRGYYYRNKNRRKLRKGD